MTTAELLASRACQAMRNRFHGWKITGEGLRGPMGETLDWSEVEFDLSELMTNTELSGAHGVTKGVATGEWWWQTSRWDLRMRGLLVLVKLWLWFLLFVTMLWLVSTVMIMFDLLGRAGVPHR